MPDVDQPLKCRLLAGGSWEVGGTGLTTQPWSDRRWRLTPITRSAANWIEQHNLDDEAFPRGESLFAPSRRCWP